MKFFLKTYGCKVNQYESQLIREGLLSSGYEETLNIVDSDLCIINTCTVTAKADKECNRILRNVLRQNPRTRIIAAGCYAQAETENIRNLNSRIEIVSNEDKTNINKLLEILPAAGDLTKNISQFKDHTKAFIKIQDGCNNFCSYCKIPFVRGRSRSRNPEHILKEAAFLLNNGYKELILTGICLGDFGKYCYKQTSLDMLVEEISKLEGDFRVRLSSIEFQDITDMLIDKMKSLKKFCHHLHIPLQSGDSEILRKMNRRYTVNEFLSRVEYIRQVIPDIGITTDVIVGFPGENDLNFSNTMAAIEKIKPVRTHIFKYSPRKNTKAFLVADNVSSADKVQRYKSVKVLTDTISARCEKEALNYTQRILVENTRHKTTGKLQGYTDSYIKVLLNEDIALMGKLYIYNPAPVKA